MGDIAEKFIEFVLMAFDIDKLMQKIEIPSDFESDVKQYLKDNKIKIVEETRHESLGDKSYTVKIEVSNPCRRDKINNIKSWILPDSFEYCRTPDISDKIDPIRREIRAKSHGNCTFTLDFGKTVKKRILEIREINSVENFDTAEKLINNYPRQIYGLMVGDEGWRFVPRKFSKSRLLKRWGSRDFVSVLASSAGVILLNLRNTAHHEKYIKTKAELRKSCQNPVEEYFYFNYDISGMDHEAFLCLEKAVITRLILDQQVACQF
jgi:hypothetical protein